MKMQRNSREKRSRIALGIFYVFLVLIALGSAVVGGVLIVLGIRVLGGLL